MQEQTVDLTEAVEQYLDRQYAIHQECTRLRQLAEGRAKSDRQMFALHMALCCFLVAALILITLLNAAYW